MGELPCWRTRTSAARPPSGQGLLTKCATGPIYTRGDGTTWLKAALTPAYPSGTEGVPWHPRAPRQALELYILWGREKAAIQIPLAQAQRKIVCSACRSGREWAARTKKSILILAALDVLGAASSAFIAARYSAPATAAGALITPGAPASEVVRPGFEISVAPHPP